MLLLFTLKSRTATLLSGIQAQGASTVLTTYRRDLLAKIGNKNELYKKSGRKIIAM